MASDERWLTRAIELAVACVPEGDGPFGAVVVRDGELVSEGTNRVTAEHDPSAHAEVVAIRAAGRALRTFDLTGAVLYSSCEPCPMCLATALWARVDRVVFAADRHDAAAAGFDDLLFYDVLAGRAPAPVPVEHRSVDRAWAPFEAWAAHDARSPY